MDETQRFKTIKDTVKTLGDQKIRLEERYKSEKERLEKLIGEITAMGYDPSNLPTIRKEKEDQLAQKLAGIEERVKKASEALKSIEV